MPHPTRRQAEAIIAAAHITGVIVAQHIRIEAYNEETGVITISLRRTKNGAAVSTWRGPIETVGEHVPTIGSA